MMKNVFEKLAMCQSAKEVQLILNGTGHAVVPIDATCRMLTAMHDGPLMANDHEMSAKTIEWLIEMWKTGVEAAQPETTESDQ